MRSRTTLHLEVSRRLDDPDHPFRILSAVPLKLLPHLAALSLRHVPELKAQAPKIVGRLPVVPNLADEN